MIPLVPDFMDDASHPMLWYVSEKSTLLKEA